MAWKFQISPNETDIIGPRYRMDSVYDEFSEVVNSALKLPFRFHKMKKIVLKFGPTPDGWSDYSEGSSGVAIKQMPHYTAGAYIELSSKDRRAFLEKMTLEAFYWFLETYDDADFIAKGLKNLGWPLPTSTPQKTM